MWTNWVILAGENRTISTFHLNFLQFRFHVGSERKQTILGLEQSLRSKKSLLETMLRKKQILDGRSKDEACHMAGVLSNSVATNLNLAKRRVLPSPTCTFCNQSQESTEHLFFHCPWVKVVWFGSCLPSLQLLIGFLASFNSPTLIKLQNLGVILRDAGGSFVAGCASHL